MGHNRELISGPNHTAKRVSSNNLKKKKYPDHIPMVEYIPRTNETTKKS